MAKRSRRSLSKKWMPAGTKRITNTEGFRVWKFGDREFVSLRELIYRINPSQKDAEEKLVSATSTADS